jgi:aminoglycoside phosphotransferase (APT) family kinase protein
MNAEPPKGTTPARDNHRFDEANLERYLADRIAGFRPPLTVRQFKGGQSNPTFWLGTPEGQYVLRKKPPGKLLPSAHQVEREYRVVQALQGSAVPVAKLHVLCEDDAIIGTPFYVMDYVSGRIFWNVQLTDLDKTERAAIYEELVRVLAALHQVDYAAAGLADFGKVGGYISRQVARWSKQYEASKTGELPAMDALMRWLPSHVPVNDETTLTHGDYRLDNLIFHPSKPRALAVIDWELSTLGHPLADLAYACMLYDIQMPKLGGLLGVDFAATGIPTEEQFVARYCELTGRSGVDDWPYYKAFSLFRLASIIQGVYKRALQGNASSDEAHMYGAGVQFLAQVACDLVGLKV